jgi:hypothetical protein
MIIKIDDFYGRLLKDLAEHHREPTAAGMIRTLVRDEAKKAGIWINSDASEPQNEVAPSTR